MNNADRISFGVRVGSDVPEDVPEDVPVTEDVQDAKDQKAWQDRQDWLKFRAWQAQQNAKTKAQGNSWSDQTNARFPIGRTFLPTTVGKPRNGKDCMFGTGCKRLNCVFTHPGETAAATPGKLRNGKDCMFGTGCKRLNCVFTHPGETAAATPGKLRNGKDCMFGTGCKRTNCVFIHPGETAAATPGKTTEKKTGKTTEKKTEKKKEKKEKEKKEKKEKKTEKPIDVLRKAATDLKDVSDLDRWSEKELWVLFAYFLLKGEVDKATQCLDLIAESLGESLGSLMSKVVVQLLLISIEVGKPELTTFYKTFTRGSHFLTTAVEGLVDINPVRFMAKGLVGKVSWDAMKALENSLVWSRALVAYRAYEKAK